MYYCVASLSFFFRNISRCAKVTDISVNLALKQLTSLQELYIANSPQLTPEIFSEISSQNFLFSLIEIGTSPVITDGYSAFLAISLSSFFPLLIFIYLPAVLCLTLLDMLLISSLYS